MYYVYILKDNKTERPYIGYTSNLIKRIETHKKEKDVQLVYYEAYLEEKQARSRERRLKFYGSAWRSLKNRLNF